MEECKKYKVIENGKEYAVIEYAADNSKRWYLNGVLHREEGPAIIYCNGTFIWFKNGVEHREDGPARIDSDGFIAWYKDGVQHRDGGPAAITSEGTRVWFKDGMIHREDGPAVEYPNGDEEWWLLNVPVKCRKRVLVKDKNDNVITYKMEDIPCDENLDEDDTW